jgi:hypothetical protein
MSAACSLRRHSASRLSLSPPLALLHRALGGELAWRTAQLHPGLTRYARSLSLPTRKPDVTSRYGERTARPKAKPSLLNHIPEYNLSWAQVKSIFLYLQTSHTESVYTLFGLIGGSLLKPANVGLK